MSDSIVIGHMKHAYLQTDGAMKFPNSREGDMLRQALSEITELEAQIKMMSWPDRTKLDAVRNEMLGQDCEHRYGKQQKRCGLCLFCSIKAALNG